MSGGSIVYSRTGQQEPGHDGVLSNTLVNVVLLVGMDNVTGLQPEGPVEDLYGCLFHVNFDPTVLTAISGNHMVHFYPFPRSDMDYPPDYNKDSLAMSSLEMMNQQKEKMLKSATLGSTTSGKNPFLQSFSPKKTLKRSNSQKPTFLIKRQPTIRRQPTIIVPDLPVSDETMRTIPSLCFPDGMKIYREKPENMCHYFVMTNMMGEKSFACCLTFYRTFYVEEDDQGHIYMNVDVGLVKVAESGIRCYVPQCCVCISSYPYFTRMKESLSSMIIRIERDPEEMIPFLKDYAHILTHTPVPPAGNIAVELNLYQMPVTLMPSSHPDRPIIDIPLHNVFLCFPPEEFLRILSYVLMEERMVFLSSNYALLSVVMESVRNLILPMKWRFTYVTVLPANGLGYLQAPGTFMFGCHSKHRQEVEQVDGLVLVDIDNGSVTINPDSSHGDTQQKQLPTVPADAADIFMEKSTKFRLQFELMDLQRPICYNLQDLRQSHRRMILETNNAIVFACLELMVNLFRGVVQKLRIEHNYFNREQFLLEQKEADKMFYKQIFKTDMFKIFLQERMAEKTDYWSDLEMKSRGIGMSKSLPAGPRRISVSLKPRASSYQLSERKEIAHFHLPGITDSLSYIRNCVRQLSGLLKDCPDYDDRTSYLYLRSLFHLASGNTMAALDDFISLSTSNSRILPVKVLEELHTKMTDEEKALFKKKPGHQALLDIMECLNDMRSEPRPSKIQMDPITIPDRDLKYEEFVQLVSQLEMTNDFDTIRRLFEALTLSTRQTYIEQMTFQMCVDVWQDNQYQCNMVTIPRDSFTEHEMVLKVSSLTNTDFGIGRIGLSDKRLFFMQDVSNVYREIVKLREIKVLEKSQNVSFLSVIDTLVIVKHDGTTFTACLKEERNWWYMIVHEMWAGKIVSDATRDVMAIHHAVQNTLLIDAIIGSGQEDCTSHHKDVEGAASLLCYYSDYMRKGRHILTPDTIKLLQNKIDPNMGELERKTIQALLYTGGEESSMLSPRLWCGLSDGKVKVYNAITWVLESEFVQTKQCVACLTAVGDNHVWAGSFGIFIIDLHTITCNKTLMDHQDLVVDIVLHGNNHAFTASLDGKIIKWNLQKLSHAQPVIQLNNIRSLRSLKIHEDKLLCGSWSSILICDLTGSLLSTLEYREGTRLVELDSFAVLSNGEVWAGCRREGKLNVWDCVTGKHKVTIPIECRGVSIMTPLDSRLWVGTKDGQICVFDIASRGLWKVLRAHEDAVRVICEVRDRYTMSGGGSKDGKVCIWLATSNVLDSGSYSTDTHL